MRFDALQNTHHNIRGSPRYLFPNLRYVRITLRVRTQVRTFYHHLHILYEVYSRAHVQMSNLVSDARIQAPASNTARNVAPAYLRLRLNVPPGPKWAKKNILSRIHRLQGSSNSVRNLHPWRMAKEATDPCAVRPEVQTLMHCALFGSYGIELHRFCSRNRVLCIGMYQLDVRCFRCERDGV